MYGRTVPNGESDGLWLLKEIRVGDVFLGYVFESVAPVGNGLDGSPVGVYDFLLVDEVHATTVATLPWLAEVDEQVSVRVRMSLVCGFMSAADELRSEAELFDDVCCQSIFGKVMLVGKHQSAALVVELGRCVHGVHG